MTKLLVVDPGNDDVEVIDLNDPSRNCQLPDLPYSMSVMGAGFTSSGPMVCSGYYSNYETSAGNCYGLGGLFGISHSIKPNSLPFPEGKPWIPSLEWETMVKRVPQIAEDWNIFLKSLK